MAGKDEYAILVVDDDEPIVKNIRRVLKRKGFTNIVSALNGEQGLKLLESSKLPFFLILSDQRMPGMSGAKFLEKSILVSPESRRMIITGFSDFDAVVDSVNRGAIHQYIAKPWNNDDLLLRIMAERDLYLKEQERKRMFKVTSHQNTKLFDFARKLRAVEQKHAGIVKKKQLRVKELIGAIKEAKAEAEYKETFLGLDELLSRTITVNKDNLANALAMTCGEIDLMMDRIVKKNKLSFSPDLSLEISDDLDDHVYEIIDQIIENVVQTVEPSLSDIGSEPDAGITVDDYLVVPDFGTLAFNDGYITRGELEQAREELEEKESQASSGLTLDRVLVSREYLRRKDLSRIFAKSALIEMRILDRELGQLLVDGGHAHQKDVARALRKQLNIFEDNGAAFLLGDILVDSGVITPEVRDEVIGGQDRSGQNMADDSAQFSSEFGAFVDLQISEDRTQAYIRVPKAVQGTGNISPIKDLIKKRGISYGIVPDNDIRNFVKNCKDPHEKFIVAQGIPVHVGKPAEISYHFNVEHESAGTINEDGSIDFSSRGDSPFVKKGGLLAEKIPMEQARQGCDIFGETLLVGDVGDVELTEGSGTLLSDDGLKLTAAIQGQPSLSLKGVVSVLEQFTVNGDVDFKTGNINFNGNVRVKGCIKADFKVECDELIADEINGGIVRIRGDLKISNGIVNGDIQTQGRVQAKFINNSRIYAYGDMMVTREIMESRIAISGKMDNEAGRITSSLIAARQGMKLKQVGTDKSEASTLKIGSDDHLRWVALQYDRQIEEIQQGLDRILDEKADHDRNSNNIHLEVANQTFVQEKITKKIDYTEKMISGADGEERVQLSRDIRALEKNMAQADQRIRDLFETQDEILKRIEDCDARIDEKNQALSDLNREKDTVMGRVAKRDPNPVLTVGRKIFAGTKIAGSQSSTVIKNSLGTCRFTEVESETPGAPKSLVHKTI